MCHFIVRVTGVGPVLKMTAGEQNLTGRHSLLQECSRDCHIQLLSKVSGSF